MFAKRPSLFASFCLVACSASPAANTQPPSHDAGGDGPKPVVDASEDRIVDAGWDATAACDSPDASPSLPCGTLDFEKSPVASRLRNHHVTMLVPSSTGTMLYAIAGFNAGVPMNYVDRAPIQSDGSLGAWASETPLPDAVGGHVGELVSGVIVVAGGTTISDGSVVVTDQAYSAVVQTDGSLGAWKAAGSVLEGRMHAGSISKNDTMWVMGGFDNQSVWQDIVSAKVQPDGTVSTWTPAGQLPGPRSHFSVTQLDDYVFIAGGLSQSAFDDPPDLQDVWRGQIQPDGTVGAWTQMSNLLVAEATQASFFYGGYLHICGGINDTALENRCWRAPVNADRTLGTFEEIVSLPIARGHVHQMPVLGRNVYSVAGAIDFNLDSTTEIDVGTFQTAPRKSRMSPSSAPAIVPRATGRKGPLCHMAPKSPK
jgi:hypothetical protein